MYGPEKARRRKGPHANVAPVTVAFRAASGDYLASTVTGNHRPRFATFARPTDATGTKGDFKGKITSIVASFDFTPENPRVKLDTRTVGHFGRPISRGHLRGRLVSPCA